MSAGQAFPTEQGEMQEALTGGNQVLTAWDLQWTQETLGLEYSLQSNAEPLSTPNPQTTAARPLSPLTARKEEAALVRDNRLGAQRTCSPAGY